MKYVSSTVYPVTATAVLLTSSLRYR